MKFIWLTIKATLTALIILQLLFSVYTLGFQAGYKSGEVSTHNLIGASCEKGMVILRRQGESYFCGRVNKL